MVGEYPRNMLTQGIAIYTAISYGRDRKLLGMQASFVTTDYARIGVLGALCFLHLCLLGYVGRVA